VVYLGLFQLLPDLVAGRTGITLKLTHRTLTYSLAALVLLHVAAANLSGSTRDRSAGPHESVLIFFIDHDHDA
jgi:cytochrome b561